MKNSLWTANFSSNIGMSGSGVVTIQNGKVSGGDSGAYYIGDFSVNEAAGTIQAKVLVKMYSGSNQSIVAKNEFTGDFSGTYHESEMELKGSVVGDQSKTITIRLRKITDL